MIEDEYLAIIDAEIAGQEHQFLAAAGAPHVVTH